MLIRRPSTWGPALTYVTCSFMTVVGMFVARGGRL